MDYKISELVKKTNVPKSTILYYIREGLLPEAKKFKSKAFKELLLSIQEKAMAEQRLLLDESFETWRGNLDQIDDVCVIGIKV